MKSIKIISLMVITAFLLIGCGAAPEEQVPEVVETVPVIPAVSSIVAEGRLEPIQYANMAFNAGGVVGEVLASIGDQVEAGQLLARLENSEALEAEVARAEESALEAQQAFDGAESQALTDLAEAYENYRLAQQRRDEYDVPSDFDGMTPVEAVEAMKLIVDEARDAYEPYMGFKPTDPFVKDLDERLDDAWDDYGQAVRWMKLEAELEVARTRMEQVEQEYESLMSGEGSEEKAVALAQYEAALANLSAARSALEDVELRAPFAGTVAGLDIRVGETVSPGQMVANMADFSGWIIKTTDLTELDVVKVEEGQEVTVTLDALPDNPLVGEVQTIGEVYAERQGDVVYEVTILLTDSIPNMRWGMTAVVKFTE